MLTPAVTLGSFAGMQTSLFSRVVATANDGEEIIKSEATSLSLAILQGASEHLNTVQEILCIIDSLEYVFRISDGRAFDPIPAIDPPEEPPAEEEKPTRMNKVATARQARMMLSHCMDFTRCKDDCARAALTWLFNARIDVGKDLHGRAQLVFKTCSDNIFSGVREDCMLQDFLVEVDWLRRLAVTYDF
jgi:hypothetical protein